jgi:redox-sensing transcriptional repressor
MSKVSRATVSRLVTYLRLLDQMSTAAVKRTSSGHLAAGAGVSAFQVRKDLTKTGDGPLGMRGVGYDVERLRAALRDVLGLTRPWNVAIVGMGRLGQALADYPNFEQYDFMVRAFFDVDQRKVGRKISGIVVSHPDELPRVVLEREIDIGFITVPQRDAQDAADALVRAGVKGILNFAPTVITVPQEVHVEPVDFLAGLKRLSFYIQKPQLKEELA